MKILTWNINGIRATKDSLINVLNALDADIICLQETKVTRDQLDEPSAIVEGFNSYFSYSKTRSGYSGVATFVRNSFTPIKAEEGLSGLLASRHASDNIGCYGDFDSIEDEIEALDSEGRSILTQHVFKDDNDKEQLLTVINVYCPRADPERDDRKAFKLKFYALLQARAESILAQGSHVIILGDVNTCHKRIDNCEPKEDFDSHPGRHWLDQLLCNTNIKSNADNSVPITTIPESPNFNDKVVAPIKSGHQFIDSFRYFHPDDQGAYTCWSTTTGARVTNYGTRIDYIFGNCDLVRNLFVDCVLMQDFQGSDHCPVKADINLYPLPAKKCPSICTKYMPEFAGKQQKLSSFFTKLKPDEIQVEEKNDEGNVVGSVDTVQKVNKNPPQLSLMFMQQKSNINTPQLKRSSNSITGKSAKKTKYDNKKSSSASQGSMLNFFTKKQSTCNEKDQIDASGSSSNETIESSCNKHIAAIKEDQSCANKDKLSQSDKKSVVNSWKNLLKGPPEAPLCKGHKEPCVFRTVKKEDSLNKGRQFWVCNRPEGHKTNPEARCDHFVWIDKKLR